jgi:hypothetical protein
VSFGNAGLGRIAVDFVEAWKTRMNIGWNCYFIPRKTGKTILSFFMRFHWGFCVFCGGGVYFVAWVGVCGMMLTVRGNKTKVGPDVKRQEEKTMKEQSKYTKQAAEFLSRNGLKMRATFKGMDKCPKWGSDPARVAGSCATCGNIHGDRFRVTLWREGKPGRVSFDFWGSYHDHQTGETELTAYDVLACISGDANTPDTFEEFCSEYGYEEDSRRAFKTFQACDRLGRKLRRLFTVAEMAELSEIQ